MLIKEYRIPLPLTVEEYRIAQLYMIAKKSRDESKGAGSGVEIIVNEPYQNGPGGNGQYTRKIYHVGSHLPGWIKSLLPKSALTVEEEAWNAYPYTKTRYTCPFVEKFSLEIETYYFGDNGHQENVFGLSGSDLRNRIVDVIDIVKDNLSGGDYVKEEDPKLFVSEKTSRGPLEETWLEDYWNEVKGKTQPTSKNMSLMCAYKLCRVEFRYWGMQTKLEKFIHDTALRKTMVRAHRQAWAWQDEWHGLTMDDIREIERQTQLALQKKMGNDDSLDDDEEHFSASENNSRKSNQFNSLEKTEENSTPQVMKRASLQNVPKVHEQAPSVEISSDDDEPEENRKPVNKHLHGASHRNSGQLMHSKYYGSKGALPSPLGSAHSFDLQVANWRMEKLEVDSRSGSEEEFFDCQDMAESTSLAKWSSLELLAEEEDASPTTGGKTHDDSIFSHAYLQRVASERGTKRRHLGTSSSIDRSQNQESPPGSPGLPPCPTTVLILVLHAGSVLDANSDLTAKKSDVTTFRGAFESVMRQHYPSLVGHLMIKLVSCPSICTDALGILSSLSPYSFDVSPSPSSDFPTLSDIPIGAIPLLTVANTQDFQDAVNRTVGNANTIYSEFLKSDEGRGFNGHVTIVGDSMGSILAHDALCRSSGRHGSEASGLDNLEFGEHNDMDASRLLTAPSPRRRSSSTSDQRLPKFDFEVGEFFMFGSPLSIVLASRRLSDNKIGATKPQCSQMYNLFHPTDPIAARLEPLISARFSMLAPVNIPRYAKYPLGNGQPYHLLELIQTNPQMFSDIPPPRRLSDTSIQSNISGLIDNVPLTTISALQQRWWGSKRLDYALYCPEGLSNFPTHALPHLFHASYWESSDVIAFILRQVGRFDMSTLAGTDDKESSFRPGQPREKWIRKRTSVKLKNVAANHRANDVIVKEGEPQKLQARFMYGPLDMITLAGEKIDVHVMKDPPAGQWTMITTEVTDKTGRVSYTIPEEKSMGYGIYPIKMVVRGDHTSVDFYLTVVPPKTETVVFSIDGSFTASMSVTGRDPKVRAGAVDVCRHWQELGYLLIYITGRPDMQQQRVVSWLSQHNFPHGLVSFADGLSTDPLGHKTAYLNNLIQNHGIVVHQAYGSNKDITVYTNIGLKPKQIYIVGKVSKKLQSLATPLSDGYAAHLNILMAPGGSRPAQGNARMVIPRACFNLPGQASVRRRSHETIVMSSPVRSGYLKRKSFLGHV